MFQLFLVLCIVSVTCASRSPLEIKQHMLSRSIACSTEHSITTEELQMLLNHQFPESKRSKCYINCVLKKMGWMDDKGMYAHDVAIKFADEEYADEPVKLENAKKVFDVCKPVNDETFPDADGCDRAQKLAKCFIEHALKNGFKI